MTPLPREGALNLLLYDYRIWLSEDVYSINNEIRVYTTNNSGLILEGSSRFRTSRGELERVWGEGGIELLVTHLKMHLLFGND